MPFVRFGRSGQADGGFSYGSASEAVVNSWQFGGFEGTVGRKSPLRDSCAERAWKNQPKRNNYITVRLAAR